MKSEIDGQMAAIRAVLSALIANHPDPGALHETLSAMHDGARTKMNATSEPSYVDGWNGVFGPLLARTAVLAQDQH